MQDGEGEDGWAQGGGFLRGGLRNVLGRLGKTAMGSFPHNPKVLAKQADKLSEVWNTALKVRAEHSVLSQQKIDDAATSRRRLWVPVLNAIPSIVKSSVLGALVFTTYETVLANNSLQQLAPGSFGGPSLFAGWCSGAVHGIASYMWDKVLLHTVPSAVERWDRLTTFRNTKLLGTVVSHSCMHASLFGSFGAFKALLSEANNNQQPSSSSLEQQVVVVVSGAMAGALADGIAYYLSPLEVGQGWRAVLRLPRPAARAILLAAFPSGIGFYAFEYA